MNADQWRELYPVTRRGSGSYDANPGTIQRLTLYWGGRFVGYSQKMLRPIGGDAETCTAHVAPVIGRIHVLRFIHINALNARPRCLSSTATAITIRAKREIPIVRVVYDGKVQFKALTSLRVGKQR